MKKSKLFLVTTQEELSKKNNFIIYGKRQKKISNNIKKENFNNIDLDFSLKINQDTELKMILDQNTGDALTLSSNSLLNLITDNSGNVNINGKYYFNIENIYSKEFLIEENSKIIWDGSRFDVNIFITADYKVREQMFINLF